MGSDFWSSGDWTSSFGGKDANAMRGAATDIDPSVPEFGTKRSSHSCRHQHSLVSASQQTLESLNGFAIDDIGERNVFAHLLYLNSDVVSNIRFGNDHDVAPPDFHDPVTLLTEILDFNVPLFALLNRRAIVFLLVISVVS